LIKIKLDNIIFEILAPPLGERNAVYEAITELFGQRLEKARSRLM